jgi:hypothetical protein
MLLKGATAVDRGNWSPRTGLTIVNFGTDAI